MPLPESLSAKDEETVKALLKKSGVVSKFEREQVSNNDIVKLRPGQWLNDEIINFYGAMILSRSSDGKENSAKANGQVNGKSAGMKKAQGEILDAHYFNSFFFSKMLSDGYQKGRLAKWTKKVRRANV